MVPSDFHHWTCEQNEALKAKQYEIKHSSVFESTMEILSFRC